MKSENRFQKDLQIDFICWYGLIDWSRNPGDLKACWNFVFGKHKRFVFLLRDLELNSSCLRKMELNFRAQLIWIGLIFLMVLVGFLLETKKMLFDFQQLFIKLIKWHQVYLVLGRQNTLAQKLGRSVNSISMLFSHTLPDFLYSISLFQLLNNYWLSEMLWPEIVSCSLRKSLTTFERYWSVLRKEKNAQIVSFKIFTKFPFPVYRQAQI